MEEECVEILSIEDIRKKYFGTEAYLRDLQKKEIGEYLKKLKNNGDDYKIKHIKKLYQIYNMFYKTLRMMISEEVYDFNDKSIDDFYSFLFYVLHCIKQDIYKFICLIQDDNFDNDELLLENLDENKKKFNTYLKFKHFR